MSQISVPKPRQCWPSPPARCAQRLRQCGRGWGGKHTLHLALESALSGTVVCYELQPLKAGQRGSAECEQTPTSA